MKLDETKILDRKKREGRSFRSLVELCKAAGPLITREFKPFEKYCGPARWSVSARPGVELLDLGIIFDRFTMPDGRPLEFQGNLIRTIVDTQNLCAYGKNHNIKSPSTDEVASAFVVVTGPTAERAFEGIVLGELWRIPPLRRSL